MKTFSKHASFRLLLSLALVLSLLTGFLPSAVALTQRTTDVFAIGGTAAGDFRLRVSAGFVLAENLPRESSFDFVAFRLKDGAGAETGILWTKRGGDNSAAFSLEGIADGLYTFELYNSAEEYGTYTSYIFGNMLSLRIQNGSALFLLSPVYEQNASVFAVRRRDKEALAFYREPSRGIESGDPEIIALAMSITGGVSGDYQKLLAVHDWVSSNIWYDYDVYTGRDEYGSQTALSTLQTKRGVCQGYASLCAALLRALGIPAKMVSGYALGIGTGSLWTETLVEDGESNHAWNEAYVDGRWVILDTTWDSGNTYENGKNTSNSGLRGHLYFDPALEIFSATHKISYEGESHLPPAAANPTVSAVLVNGNPVSFDAYNIADNNYFKLRDIAYALRGSEKQFEVIWDGAANSILLTSGSPYTIIGGEMQGKGTGIKEGLFNSAPVYLDGQSILLTAYNIGGNNYIKLRDIGRAFDFDVSWDGVSGTILIDTSSPYTDD